MTIHDGCLKVTKVFVGAPPKVGELKFNVDRAARGKPGPAGRGGVLRNYKGVVVALFSKHVVIMESNEAEVVTTLEVLQIFSHLLFKGF